LSFYILLTKIYEVSAQVKFYVGSYQLFCVKMSLRYIYLRKLTDQYFSFWVGVVAA